MRYLDIMIVYTYLYLTHVYRISIVVIVHCICSGLVCISNPGITMFKEASVKKLALNIKINDYR